MRILMASDLFYPVLYSGGEVRQLNIAKELVKLGHEVTVLASRTAYHDTDIKALAPLIEIDGVHIIRVGLPFKFGSSLGSIPSMLQMYRLARSYIDEGLVDVLYATQCRPCLPLSLAARGKVPCVAIIHDLYPKQSIPGRIMERLMLAMHYDRVFTGSDSSKRQLARYIPESLISVVYNGVDLKAIDAVPAPPKKPYQIMYAGSFKEFKNIGDAIQAVVSARAIVPDLELVIVSTGGPEEHLVQEATRTYPYIKYFGKVSEDEKTRLMKESAVLILPSSQEGFGLVLIEALACGTPFIAYNIPAVNEVARMTGGGAVVKHRNFEAMATHIICLVKNPDVALHMATIGRKAVEERFTWPKIAQAEEEVLRRLVKC